MVSEGYTYDPRQTDHAWVESRVFLVDTEDSGAPGSFDPGGEYDEVKWWPLNPQTVNRLPSGTARFIREAVIVLKDSGRMDPEVAELLLAKTG